MKKNFKNLWRAFSELITDGETILNSILAGVLAVISIWIGTSDFSIWEWRPSDKQFTVTGIVCALSIVFITLVSRNDRNHRINALKSNYEKKIKYFKDTLDNERRLALEDCLQEISKNLNYTMQERICVYRFLPEEESFDCVARYSLHPELTNFAECKRYPTDRGIIAHVWNEGANNGVKRDHNIPNATPKNPYNKYMRETYNISRDVVDKWRMKAIDIRAEVIRDNKEQAIAVIVFESQQRGFIDETNIQSVYNRSMKSKVILLLEKLKIQHSPNSHLAEEIEE